MYPEKKIEALLVLDEDGKIVKVIKFYLRAKTDKPTIRSTTFARTFDESRYMLTLIAGEERPSFELKPKLGIPCISVSSLEEINLSDKKLPNFLISVISEDHMKEQIQNHIRSFVREI